MSDGSVPQEIVEKASTAMRRSPSATYGELARHVLAALSLEDIQALLQAKTDMDVLYLDSWRVIAFRERTKDG